MCIFSAVKRLLVFICRFPLAANTISILSPTPRKKFDLQASLAKPLPYKPYSGKLQAASSENKEENKKPIKRTNFANHKVDIKSVKVSTRWVTFIWCFAKLLPWVAGVPCSSSASHNSNNNNSSNNSIRRSISTVALCV